MLTTRLSIDTTLFPAPKDIDDDLLILMADVWPTGWYAAKTAYGMLNEIERVDAVAVVIGWGPISFVWVDSD
jgi:threonine dehydrogenase-like Zn-dependent dehydrogenase